MVQTAKVRSTRSLAGADVVLPPTEGWAQQVRPHLRSGVDIVVDPIGGPTFDDALAL